MIVNLAVCALAVASVAADSITVDSSFGQVSGNTLDGVDSFLGIQYATVGQRFARSTLIQTQPAILNATSYGPFCYQSIPPGADEVFNVYTAQQQDEECLFLNIWRPENTTSSSYLTTMVFIHGGGFNIGSGAEPFYSGANLVREHGILVVNLNYRLGMFGFLVTGENGYGGLNGIHDQINALTWIQNHIQSFGGDPNQVTIFGESAGSVAVCLLCVSPLASGLFQRAILQSGECVFGILAPNAVEVGEMSKALMLNSTNATSVEDLANATRFPAETIAPFSATIPVGWPTVDGWVLPEHPRLLFSDENKIVPTEMIVGSNSYDAPLAVVFPPETYIALANNMQAGITEMFGPEYGAAILEAYAPEKYNGNQIAAYTQYDGDFFFRCASRQLAALAADHLSGKVFLYNYAHLSAVDPSFLNGFQELAGIQNVSTWASHGADLPMVFGTFNEFTGWWSRDSAEPSADDLTVRTEMVARWVAFAKTGSPNTDAFVGWTSVSPTVTSQGNATSIPTFLLLKEGGKMSEVPEKVEQCSTFAFSFEPTLQQTSSGSLTQGSFKEFTMMLILCQIMNIIHAYR